MGDGRRRGVWIGAAGTATGWGVARSIRDAWGDAVTIVSADINPERLVATAVLADAHEQVPLVADRDAFATTLRDGLERHGVDTYVPLLVAEIALAAQLRDAGELPGGVAVLAPPVAAAEACDDKLALAGLLAGAGVPVPPTVAAGEARWWAEGVVVKPRAGEGARDVEVVEHERDLAAARGRGDAAVAQRRCMPPEVTVDAYRSRDGASFAAVCRERLEVKAGVATKARVFSDAALEGVVRTVADALGLTGALCVQAMRAPDDAGWEITDVNPRSGGGSRMSAAAGVDVVAAALAERWGEDPWPHLAVPLAAERWVVRHHSELVTG